MHAFFPARWCRGGWLACRETGAQGLRRRAGQAPVACDGVLTNVTADVLLPVLSQPAFPLSRGHLSGAARLVSLALNTQR